MDNQMLGPPQCHPVDTFRFPPLSSFALGVEHGDGLDRAMPFEMGWPLLPGNCCLRAAANTLLAMASNLQERTLIAL